MNGKDEIDSNQMNGAEAVVERMSRRKIDLVPYMYLLSNKLVCLALCWEGMRSRSYLTGEPVGRLWCHL